MSFGGFLVPKAKDLSIISLFNNLALSVPHEGYTRNAIIIYIKLNNIYYMDTGWDNFDFDLLL